MLNVALQVFVENGYEQASTNRIVKQAGIGKEMLFHYFGSKEDLFHYLVNHAIQFISENYVDQFYLKEWDFIERLKQAAKLKMNVYRAHPDLFNFIGMIYMNEPERLSETEMKELNALQTDGFAKLYEGIDTTIIRDDISTEKALKLIQWSIDGYQQEMIGLFRGKNLTLVDFDPYWEEFADYMEVLKTVYYK
ncbi:TetR/AcrR family transcriptional regulator [Sporosarcina obsidiansis]|uniref:TetR/AcrR family transcriptional regulator n=1 Tax=Sporosarcina obsidiansis TaxID=2660748 RepID=UPI00129A96EA|nr:TetR/AcrR family transcriptional regulator [Sporosarcina obsidiansis]